MSSTKKEDLLQHLKSTAIPIRISYYQPHQLILIPLLIGSVIYQIVETLVNCSNDSTLLTFFQSDQWNTCKHDPSIDGLVFQHLSTSILLLVYLIIGYFDILGTALDSAFYVYLIWPMNYMVVKMTATPTISNAHNQLIDILIKTHLPVVVWVIYISFQRHLILIRLWQHYQPSSTQKRYDQSGGNQTVLVESSEFQMNCGRPASRYSYRCSFLFHLYTISAPFILEIWFAQVNQSLWHQPVSVFWMCLFNFVLIRLLVSFYGFQIQFLIWIKGNQDQRGILVWRSGDDGWRAGILN